MGKLKVLLFSLVVICMSNIQIVDAKNHWKQDTKGYYYQYDNDTYAKSKWIKDNNHWYYIQSNGYRAVGWLNIHKKWYYFNNNGILQTDKWISDKYYVNKDGEYKYKLSNNMIKNYHKKSVYDTEQYLKQLNSNWTSFIVVTDIHGQRNENHSQEIVRYLLTNVPNLNCFLLGDFGSDTEFKSYIEPLKNKKNIYTTVGNHDMSTDTSVIYNTLLKNKKNLKGSPKKFYYYFDDTDKKLRYLIINTCNSDKSSNQMNDTELEWLQKEGLKLPNSKWNVIVLGHHDIDIKANLPYTNKSAEQIAKYISQCNGNVVGYFCGHEHLDNQSLVNKKFYQTIFNSDCLNVNQKWRKTNTINDQSITVVSVNTKTGHVVFHRIGTPIKNINTYRYK